MIRIRLCIKCGGPSKSTTICDSMLLQMITRIANYCLSVADETRQVYSFEPLEKYGFKERLIIRMADVAFFALISLIGSSIRWETQGLQHLEEIESAGCVPIYCLWHERLFAGTFYLRDRGIVVITSQSRDGEYIARFLKRFGLGPLGGRQPRGGVQRLAE